MDLLDYFIGLYPYLQCSTNSYVTDSHGMLLEMLSHLKICCNDVMLIFSNSKEYDGNIDKRGVFLETHTPVFWLKEWKKCKLENTKYKLSMLKLGQKKKLPRSMRLRLINRKYVLAEQVLKLEF